MTFPLNRWYVAAWADEVGSHRPLARTLLDEPVVLFRTEEGRVAALEDRCCHRNLPLSHGRVQGEQITCGYHGLVFDCTGRCVHAPGQETVPPAARVRSFPVVEQDGAVWFWPGDPAMANPADIPSYPIHGHARWAYRHCYYRIACHHELINDNLIDLSHVGYVHGRTIGGTPQAHSDARMEVHRDPDGVTVRRWMPASVPPPTYQRLVGFEGLIDRWMEITFVPGVIRIYIGANEVGRGLDEAGHMDRMGLRIFNAITPETATSTHYLWSAAHNFKTNDEAVTDLLFRDVSATFEEDRTVVEAQQARYSRFPDRPTVSLKVDAGALHARRVIAELQRRDALAS